MAGRFGLVAIAALLSPLPLAAQTDGAARAPRAALGLAAAPTFVASAPPLHESAQADAAAARAAGLSLLVPGLGQHTQGRARKWIFASLEVAGWVLYLERRSAGGRARDAYRDFAWERARVQSSTRVDGDFDYYETLTQWPRSGAFDADASAAGVQPEMDPGSFNGSIWARAAALFLGGGAQEGDPGFEQARAFYEANAYDERFLWDWSRTPDGRAELAARITRSDDRFREATTVLGVIIANHAVAAVDAFLGGRAAAGGASVDLAPDPARGAWALELRVPVRW